jgi:hypothetical protein
MSKTIDKSYLTSKEAKKILKVSDCDLAHLRMDGKLPFVKKGNAYMYETDFVDKMKGELIP